MKTNLQTCFDLTVLKWERAEYTNTPGDPGGPTKYGVTIVTLSHELGRRATIDDVKNMTEQTAMEIMRKKFWNVIGADDLPSGVDMEAFDICYNAGPGRVLPWLEGTARLDVVSRIEALHSFRMTFWKRLKIWATFGRGWTNREKDVLTHALSLARSAT